MPLDEAERANTLMLVGTCRRKFAISFSLRSSESQKTTDFSQKKSFSEVFLFSQNTWNWKANQLSAFENVNYILKLNPLHRASSSTMTVIHNNRHTFFYLDSAATVHFKSSKHHQIWLLPWIPSLYYGKFHLYLKFQLSSSISFLVKKKNTFMLSWI